MFICTPGRVNILEDELSKYKAKSVLMCLMFVCCSGVQKIKAPRTDSQSRQGHLADLEVVSQVNTKLLCAYLDFLPSGYCQSRSMSENFLLKDSEYWKEKKVCYKKRAYSYKM